MNSLVATEMKNTKQFFSVVVFPRNTTKNEQVLNSVFYLFSPLAYVDPGHCNMAHLFVELLKDSLNEYAYDAEIAGVEYKLENTMYGIFVSKFHKGGP